MVTSKEDQPEGPIPKVQGSGLLASTHLSTPKSHQRTDSSYSRNYSLLDIYGTESPMEDDNSSPERGLNASIMKELNKLDFHDVTADKTLFLKDTVLASPASPSPVSPDTTIFERKNYIQPMTSKNLPSLLESPYDRYGFKKASNHHNISKTEYNDWFAEYSEYSLRRKKKWNLLMKANGLGLENDDSIPTRFPPKSDKVKKMIRRGIPAEWRGNAWFFYAGGNEKLNKHVGVYQQIVQDTANVQNKDTEVIERDLNRTFPDNIYFNDSIGSDLSSSSSTTVGSETLKPRETGMIKALRRVLVAFAHYQPQIGYCQSLNFLAGLLLLFMEEERAFWMLVILTERIIPKVHSANLEGVHTDQGVLMLCVKEYVPQLWNILGKTFEGEVLSEDKILTRLPPVTLVTSSWFMSLFVGILPIETVLRVWDILWYEGSKTIFRISLTICKMCLDNPEFQSARNASSEAEMDQIELFQFMQNFPKIILDPNFLIDNCFKKIGGYGFGSLPQDEINNCREFVSKQRAKLNNKKTGLATELTEEERKSLISGSGSSYNEDGNIHDVYGFHRSLMSGVVWNKNMSNKMRKKFSKKTIR